MLDLFFVGVPSIPFLCFSNIFSPLHIIMTTLLDSRKQHLRSWTLSRKVRKAEVLNGEPSNRRLPVICRDTHKPEILDERPHDALQPVLCPDSVPIIVSTENANICPSNDFAHSSVMDEVLERSSTHFRWQQSQRIRRDRERRQKAGKRRKRDNHIRLVRHYIIVHCFMYHVVS